MVDGSRLIAAVVREVVRLVAYDFNDHDSLPNATQTWKVAFIADYCRSSEATVQAAVDIDFHRRRDS